MMTTTTKNGLDGLLRFGIGLDPWFFEKNADSPNFPPHNIVQLDENNYVLTLAVAGFRNGELSIVSEGDLLTISGRKDDEANKEGRKVLYQGIAFRDFTRQFKIGENVKVQDATLHSGLLSLVLVREIPEAQRPKQIAIHTSNL